LRDYLWASPVGRIRIIEKGLLTRSDLAKVLDAGNLEGALLALRDSFYGPYVSKLENPDMFEVALQEAVKAVHDKVMKLAPEPLVIAAYRVPPEEGAFSSLGNLTPEELKGALEPVRRGEAPAAPQELEPDSVAESAYKVTCELAAVYAQVLEQDQTRQLTSFEVDSLIDKSYYAWAASVYSKSGYDALVDIIRSEIDIVNLKMAVRARRLGISSPDFEGILIPGGSIDTARLAEGYSKGYAGIASAYKDTRLERLAARGVSLAQKGQPLTGWERECDNAMVRLVRQARKISLGPEPVFGYMFGRELEVRNLRIILAGKQSEISEHEISERLRESYA